MAVAREAILSALEEMGKLEEVSVLNLAQVRRFNFRKFPPAQRKRIEQLLDLLREDTNEHQQVLKLIRKKLKK